MGEGHNAVKLSRRLQAVAGMVTKGNVVCDIGCDHGFVSIYLIQKGISPGAIAMDVNRGPLRAAGEHVGEYGLTGYIETRLSDGAEALAAGEADTLICAGMGGKLTVRILEEGKDKVRQMKEIILQPQSEIQMVREYLRKAGYSIADENMVLEEDKYYPVMKALPEGKKGGQAVEWEQAEGSKRDGKPRYAEISEGTYLEDKYGPVLLRRKDPVLKSFLHREYDLCMEIMGNLRANGRQTEKRQEEIAERMRGIEEAFSRYYENGERDAGYTAY